MHMMKGRCEYLEMLQPNTSAEEFLVALDKGFQFIASHIRMMVGSIDDDEGLAIIRMLKASPFNGIDQAKLIGYIDDQVAGEPLTDDPVKEKGKDVPVHGFWRRSDWDFTNDKGKTLSLEFLRHAQFLKDMGDPKLSEPCIAKLLTVITSVDNEEATYTVQERLNHLTTFKSCLAAATPKGTSKVLGMPDTPEKFRLTHRLWYSSVYRHDGACPAKTWGGRGGVRSQSTCMPEFKSGLGLETGKVNAGCYTAGPAAGDEPRRAA